MSDQLEMSRTTFSVTASTLSAKSVGQYLQMRYDLSNESWCQIFRTGMNHLYIVTDKGVKYAFRIYTFNWRTKLEIEEEVRLLIHLKNENAPISYPIADKSNVFIHEFNAPEGIRYGVMFSFAHGSKNPRFDSDASYLVGQALAKIHLSTENYPLNRVTYDPKTLLVDAMARTKIFFNKPSEEISFLDQTASFLQKEFEKIQINKVRKGAVHLDVWFDNLHFDYNKEVTIFDFDFCGNGWLSMDISYFLYQLYSTNQNDEEYQIKAAAFLNGYESFADITQEEKRVLPFLCLAIMTFYISMQCEKYDTWSNIFLNEDHLKRLVGSLKRWANFSKLNIV